MEGLVMVDLKSYFEDSNIFQERSGRAHASVAHWEDLMSTDDCRPSFVDGTCAFCQDLESKGHRGKQGQVALFGDYNFIDPEDHEELSSHIYMLCPAEIKAFAFKTRMWGKISMPAPREAREHKD